MLQNFHPLRRFWYLWKAEQCAVFGDTYSNNGGIPRPFHWDGGKFLYWIVKCLSRIFEVLITKTQKPQRKSWEREEPPKLLQFPPIHLYRGFYWGGSWEGRELNKSVNCEWFCETIFHATVVKIPSLWCGEKSKISEKSDAFPVKKELWWIVTNIHRYIFSFPTLAICMDFVGISVLHITIHYCALLMPIKMHIHWKLCTSCSCIFKALPLSYPW